MDSFFTRMERSTPAAPKKPASGVVSLELLHKQECRACPLDKIAAAHPKMAPTGASSPTVYVLGEAPGAEEDELGAQFIGKSGKLLRGVFTIEQLANTRFNNCIRTRPPNNRTPNEIEIECCRPSIVRDIEVSKPKAIFGFGNVPLNWVTGFSNIVGWRGRVMPVKIGTHVCWFFPMLHPAYVLRAEHAQDSDDSLGPAWREVFERDIKQAWKKLETLGDPFVESDDPAVLDEGVTVFEGKPHEVDTVVRLLDSWQGIGTTDIETNALRPYSGTKILCAAISNFERTLAFPLDDTRAQWGSEGRRRVWEAYHRWLVRKDEKAAHNAKFEFEHLSFRLGPAVLWSAKWHDTMVQAYVLDDRAAAQSLAAVTFINFGLRLKDASGVVIDDRVDGLTKANLELEPLRKVLLYCARDAKYTHADLLVQTERINSLGLSKVYEMQLERLPALVAAQIDGMPVSQATVISMKEDYTARSRKLEEDIQNRPEIEDFRRNFGTFNPTSPDSLVLMFRDVLKRKEGAGRDGKYSTDEKALSKMTDVPLAQMIVDLRRLEKVISTYITPLDIRNKKSTVVHPDGLLHTIFNSTFTTTGRLSSEDPNMQNFPKRKNAEVRRMIQPPPGHSIVAADYGQIEARVIGMASKCHVLCKALWTGYDIHMAWAEKIASVDPGALKVWGSMKNLRSEVKNKFVFPAFYGSEWQPIARNLKLRDRDAQMLFGEFWEEFVDVRTWQRSVLDYYTEHGEVVCLTGRPRRGPLNDNMKINSPIQGTASDIVVDAMTRLSRKAYETDEPSIRPRLNIHDDLTFIVPDEKLESSVETIVREMVAVKFDFVNVPIAIEVSVGKNWYEMHEIGKFESHKL